MREILFRGKRTDNGEWAKGYYIHRPTAVCIGESNPSCIWVPAADPDDSTKIFEVFSETVGQFTGLTDKNGRKIFEGDIVKYSTNKFGIINYGIACFSVQDIKSRNNPALDIIFADYSNVEVIGNIYDNPELLEVKK